MTKSAIALIVSLPLLAFSAEPILPVKIRILTNNWNTDWFITPHFRGQSNFNSTTYQLQSSEWVTKEIHITVTDEGNKVETVVRETPTTVTRENTAVIPGQPFWYDGVMWQITPSNAPPILDRKVLQHLRTRGEHPPVPPLPPR